MNLLQILFGVVIITIVAAFLWFLLKTPPPPEPSTMPTPEQEENKDSQMFAESAEGAAPPAEGLDASATPVETGLDPALEAEANTIRNAMRTALTNAYAAQKSFFAEYGRYSTDIRLVGIDLPKAPMNFRMGFLAPGEGDDEFQNEDPREMDTDAFAQIAPDENGFSYRYSKYAEHISLQDYASKCEKGCTANEDGFEIIAAFRIAPDAKAEIWKIDDKRNLQRIQE